MVTLLRSRIRRFTIIISTRLLQTISNFNGQEFGKNLEKHWIAGNSYAGGGVDNGPQT